MGFITWLTDPIRETHRLAPHDSVFRSRDFTSRPVQIEADTFDKLEQQRLAALMHRRRSLIVGVPVVLAVAGLTFLVYRYWGHDIPDAALRGVFGLILAGLFLRLVAGIGLWMFTQTAKHRVLSALAEQQGLEYSIGGVDSDETKPFEEHGLFGSSSNGGQNEDAFSGVIDGVEFLLFEAERKSISRSNNSSSSTVVFHGLCLRLSFPKRFSGTTRVLSDYGALNKLHEMDSGSLTLERVRLEDPAFEKLFEAVTTDQVEARYLLTPGLMERLVETQKVLGERTKLRAAFHDRDLLLALDTRKNRPLWRRIFGGMDKLHHFEIKDTGRPVDQMDMTRQFERELDVTKALVKTLKINMKTRV
ncbi:MAG: DUF3137 domain-containing protein [Acidobacteriota bacterium]